jgi:hypothetical protein
LVFLVGTGVGACATGIDTSIGDDGGANGDDVVTSPTGQDTGTRPTGYDATSGGPDAPASGNDAASAGDSSSTGYDASPLPDGSTVQPDTGTTAPDTGTTQPDSSTGTPVCPNDLAHGAEATAAIASGSFTLCLTGVCAPGQCCFTLLNPGDICVTQ